MMNACHFVTIWLAIIFNIYIPLCMYVQIVGESLNFRKWYKHHSHLLNDENNDLFPPRFKLKLVNKDYNLSSRNLNYKLKICIQNKKRGDAYFTLNISGFGHHSSDKSEGLYNNN